MHSALYANMVCALGSPLQVTAAAARQVDTFMTGDGVVRRLSAYVCVCVFTHYHLETTGAIRMFYSDLG